MTARNEPELREVASGLRFPEGPVWMPDGSLLVVEIQGQCLTRILPDRTVQVVASLGGGPNGAAIGPDGRCYVCNNGGLMFKEVGGKTMPLWAPDDYAGGSIQVVDLASGLAKTLYDECDGMPLSAPNDLVFDDTGGFWFTDTGKMFKRHRQKGAIFYARADGSAIRQVVFPVDAPNGIGLSRDGSALYVAETHTGRIWSFEVSAPGMIKRHADAAPWEQGRLLASARGYSLFDSLAVDGSGNICVADIPHGGISVYTAAGELLEQHAMPDIFPTNICFGGADLRTAFITLSSTGRVVSMAWKHGGLALHGGNDGGAGSPDSRGHR